MQNNFKPFVFKPTEADPTGTVYSPYNTCLQPSPTPDTARGSTTPPSPKRPRFDSQPKEPNRSPPTNTSILSASYQKASASKNSTQILSIQELQDLQDEVRYGKPRERNTRIEIIEHEQSERTQQFDIKSILQNPEPKMRPPASIIQVQKGPDGKYRPVSSLPKDPRLTRTPHQRNPRLTKPILIEEHPGIVREIKKASFEADISNIRHHIEPESSQVDRVEFQTTGRPLLGYSRTTIQTSIIDERLVNHITGITIPTVQPKSQSFADISALNSYIKNQRAVLLKVKNMKTRTTEEILAAIIPHTGYKNVMGFIAAEISKNTMISPSMSKRLTEVNVILRDDNAARLMAGPALIADSITARSNNFGIELIQPKTPVTVMDTLAFQEIEGMEIRVCRDCYGQICDCWQTPGEANERLNDKQYFNELLKRQDGHAGISNLATARGQPEVRYFVDPEMAHRETEAIRDAKKSIILAEVSRIMKAKKEIGLQKAEMRSIQTMIDKRNVPSTAQVMCPFNKILTGKIAKWNGTSGVIQNILGECREVQVNYKSLRWSLFARTFCFRNGNGEFWLNGKVVHYQVGYNRFGSLAASEVTPILPVRKTAALPSPMFGVRLGNKNPTNKMIGTTREATATNWGTNEGKIMDEELGVLGIMMEPETTGNEVARVWYTLIRDNNNNFVATNLTRVTGKDWSERAENKRKAQKLNIQLDAVGIISKIDTRTNSGWITPADNHVPTEEPTSRQPIPFHLAATTGVLAADTTTLSNADLQVYAKSRTVTYDTIVSQGRRIAVSVRYGRDPKEADLEGFGVKESLEVMTKKRRKFGLNQCRECSKSGKLEEASPCPRNRRE